MMVQRTVVWMFSGQGSQYHHMGRDLYENEPTFRESIHLCDSIVNPWIRASLVDLLYNENRTGNLVDTHLSHLSICAVQYAMARTLLNRGFRPDLLLGYSLGEMIAHIVAESVSIETGLELLYHHARLMEAKTPEGGMLAILEKPEVISPLLEIIPDLWIAAHNFENHCVVSGALHSIDRLQVVLETKKTTTLRLPVRRAFHCSLMDSAETEFRNHIKKTTWKVPNYNITSSATDFISSGGEGLWAATREPVKFMHAIHRLENSHKNGILYVDLGPSGTLSTFVKYINTSDKSNHLPIMTPWGGSQKNIEIYKKSI